MGFAISWLAVETSDHEALQTAARLRATSEPDPEFEGAVSGAALPNGWFLLVAKGPHHRLVGADLLRALSSRWTCLACTIEEHVMCSTAALWTGGAMCWEVSHDAQKGIHDLQVSGAPPEAFASLREQAFAEQRAEGGQEAGVDFVFEVPLQLAQQLVGFKHDEASAALAGVVPRVFEDLEEPARPRPWRKPW